MTTQTAIPGYGLAPPSKDDALAFLARGVGADQAAALWVRACRESGASATARDLGPETLMKVAEWLARQSGIVGVIGTSLSVRLRTYRLLTANRGVGGGQ
ncbi:MAG TPA: hypothetical protein VF665_01605 [Longimicrobium sp.]|jgi:hypothetical protein|uniref:hypothetical protein n=1 Tax=Longimicrobium sp. TaxID=2029185 RepID=UPI002EDAA8A7